MKMQELTTEQMQTLRDHAPVWHGRLHRARNIFLLRDPRKSKVPGTGLTKRTDITIKSCCVLGELHGWSERYNHGWADDDPMRYACGACDAYGWELFRATSSRNPKQFMARLKAVLDHFKAEH